MALTKVSRGLLSTGIVDNSNATAITLNADESATFAAPLQLTAGALAAAGNAGLSHRSADNKVYLQAGTGGFNVLDDQQNTHLAIDSAGVSSFHNNVGIGTSPSSELHVKGTNETQIYIEAAAGSNSGIRLLENGTSKWTIGNDQSNDGLFFYDFTASSEAMRITGAGNVGIGVSSPQRVLTLGKGDSSGVQTQYTNSTTGAGLGDGFTVGIDGSENAEFWNYSSTNMLFATNSTQRMILSSSGEFTLGNPSAGSALQLDVSATGSDGVDIKGTYYTGSYGPMKFHTGGTERMRIDSSGVILAGSTSKTFGGIDATRLAVVGGSNSSSNAVQMIVDEDGSVEGGSTLLAVGFSGDNSFSTANYINFFDSGGQQGRIEGTGAGAVSYQSGSDERLKSNIRDTASKWDALKQIRVRDFEWTADTSNKTVTGFIAQELHNIFPDAVSEGGDDVTKNPWTVDYGRTSPIVIKALQEAMDRIETLEAKVQTLENN